MVSTFYRYESGEVVEISGLPPEVEAAAVHDDTLPTPLCHPVTRRIHDSKSAYLRDCEATGTRVVGNDWLGLEPSRPADLVTDAVIVDRIQKAEAILRDPARRRERQNLNYRMAEHNERFMRDGKILVNRHG